MKKLVFICLVLSNYVQAQWSSMQRFEEFGIGNFYLFASREVDARRLIAETFNDNDMKGTIDFHKGANLLLNVAVEDPQNSEFVYVVIASADRKTEYQVTTSFVTTSKTATGISTTSAKRTDASP
jgi:hypothetical protein